MFAESILAFALILAALLCTLVAGFVLLFAIVIMPGIGTLPNREFLQAFQVMDGVIQNNQPIFILVWVGSAVALLVAAILGVWQLEWTSRILILTAATVFILGVQLPTITINIPLNNRLQILNLEELDQTTLAAERQNFEPRWNRWNIIRTFFAGLASVLILIVVRLN